MASLKPRCYLAGCDKPVSKDNRYFCTQRDAAEFGTLMAKAKGRTWCYLCATWVLMPEMFHAIWRHGKLEVS